MGTRDLSKKVKTADIMLIMLTLSFVCHSIIKNMSLTLCLEDTLVALKQISLAYEKKHILEENKDYSD